MDKVANNVVVSFHYILKDPDGNILDRTGDATLDYLHGHKNIIPGLESELDGKGIGDKFSANISAEEAYGPRDENMIQSMPKEQFKGISEIEIGMQFEAQTEDGPVTVTVTEMDGENITIDGNHPLAGIDLTFEVEITAMRAATEEELSHGHVHNGDDHGH